MHSSPRVLAGIQLLVIGLVAAAPATGQPQTPDQQRCITALNGDFAKVAKARSKTLLRCARQATRGDSASDCLGASAARFEKVLDKLASTQTKKCSAAPDFGPNDVSALAAAGVSFAEINLSDLLGLDLDGVLANVKAKATKNTAKCQLALAGAAQKCALGRVQLFNRCKKAGVRDGTIQSPEGLTRCLSEDPKGQLPRLCTAKLDRVVQGSACGSSDVDLATAFPPCGARDPAGLLACAEARIPERVGEALAAADGIPFVSRSRITPELDAERTATATIGPAGGFVEAIAGDGTVYRLEVPAGALAYEEALSLTPVSAIPDLPLTGGLVAAVHFAPDGLQLLEAATLTVEAASEPDPGTLAAFGYAGSGDGFHLDILGLEGSVLTFAVTHFSGVGAGVGQPGDLGASYNASMTSTEAQYKAQLAWLVPLSAAPDDYVEVFAAWYDAAVKPKLQNAAAADPALKEGVAEFAAWVAYIDFVKLWLGFPDEPFFALNARRTQGRGLAAAALRAGIARGNEHCLAQQTLGGAEAALLWQATAAGLGVATGQEQLDLESVLEELCVEVLYQDVSYPQSPSAGVPGTLSVGVGYAFTGGALLQNKDFEIVVQPTGTQQGTTVDVAPFGSYSGSFTPTAEIELVLRVAACLGTLPEHPVLHLKLCQTALVVRGFRITPAMAQLEPGQVVDFAALLYGAPHPSVAWSATGGTIGAQGLYTAGDTEGTFSVVANSNTTPGISESATVIIGDSAPVGEIVRLLSRSSETRAEAASRLFTDPGSFNVVTDPPNEVPEESLSSGSLSASTSHVSGGGSGSGSGMETLTLGFDGSGNLSEVGSQALATASGISNAGGTADGHGRVLFELSFEVIAPVLYEISASPEASASGPSQFEGSFLAHGRMALFGNGFVFSRGARTDLDQDPVGDETGVLAPGIYTVSSDAGATAGSSNGNGVASADGQIDFSLTLTPQ